MRTFYYDGVCIQNRRKTNMDSLLLKKRIVSGKEVCLAAVCDGVGSLEAGAVASSIAIQMLIEWMNQVESDERIDLALIDIVQRINQRVVLESIENGFRTASTISALLLTNEKYYTVHAGDSRIYRYTADKLTQLTEDQVLSGKLAMYLGRTDGFSPLYREGDLQEEKFLLCSDGLYKKLDTKRMEKYCSQVNRSNISRILEKFVQAAVKNGESDNISAAFVLHEK